VLRELVDLRRGDIDLQRGVARMRRGVVRVNGEILVGTPKSIAGVRDVAVPPHLLPVPRGHLDEHVARGRDALLFPVADGRNLRPSSLYSHFSSVRLAVGRPHLRFSDLRLTGAVLAASTGATLAELMARLGHSTPAQR
jgi:integrase